MPGVIKMSYADMVNMAQVFDKSSETINQTISAMNTAMGLLGEGALQGKPGTQLENAVSQSLNTKLKQLADKMTELKTDISNAQNELQQSDEQGAKGF